ncbi:GNAT family N-acetyltransferase [Azospirillum sp. A39]|uniref:GNAT family N-acetyltransferase n=1 Tax=Azospirillum sp. A39 TaxID=3462279 RepID=UPI0040462907
MPFRFRHPTLDDAALLLAWRTDPAITRFMFTDLEGATVETQRAWLRGMAGRADVRHFVIEHRDRPVGYLAYSEIDRVNRRCSSGSYIVDPEARRGVAGLLYNFIMDYCFHGLGMNKMVNQFMEGNDAVIAIQRRLKIREVGVLRQHVWKHGRFHDVHLFELLKSEWDARPHPFPRERTLAAFPDGEGMDRRANSCDMDQ